MPPTKDRYHHGALREELLRACLQLIATEGLAAVSLRRVAREAGVSPGAPYHHFADRAALLAALSAQGFEALTARLTAARDSAASPVDSLTALADAYVRFAEEQPAYFRLMFRPELVQPEKSPEARAAGDAAFTVLAEAIAEIVRDGALPAAEADAVAVAVWSMAHGLASLSLDGQLTKRATQLGTTAPDLGSRITRMFGELLAARAGH
ncbi:TetR/AcrR family transcriptional regulator [Nocardia blacklockiae]|uniref:TetR/AcrR family transcriptional regulator n=1 Tax=Nocardia blacklockiae TaxID=480036 RepID=UPI001895E90A|nr:TetR/AcrR family transcriptional regulator [Nocardia blacklockiae]MBF6170702.1 TetR/AcrR family transcriptional regulator [Nocardia blacklockiae]